MSKIDEEAMNFKIVEEMIELVEDKEKLVTAQILSSMEEVSQGHARDLFKKVVGMSIDKYRIRRQLSLVMIMTHNSKISLSKADIRPWLTMGGFRKAFKSEFGMLPSAFLKKIDRTLLQPKFDILIAMRNYKEESIVIKNLIGEHGSESAALLFLLSLAPYTLTPLDIILNLVKSYDQIVYRLIMGRYLKNTGKKFVTKNIPRDFIQKHKKILFEYYLPITRSVENEFFNLSMNKTKMDIEIDIKFVISKRSLVNELVSNINLAHLIYLELSPSDLHTNWDVQFHLFDLKPDEIRVPNDFASGKFSPMEREILFATLISEQGGMKHESWESMANWIEIDENYPDCPCSHCQFMYDCSGEQDCKFDFDMTDDFETPLTVEMLTSYVGNMLIKGLLYFSNTKYPRL